MHIKYLLTELQFDYSKRLVVISGGYPRVLARITRGSAASLPDGLSAGTFEGTLGR